MHMLSAFDVSSSVSRAWTEPVKVYNKYDIETYYLQHV